MSMAREAWPLTPGLPALDAFPYALWGRLEGRFWRRRPAPDLSYGDPQGFLPLREALAEYLGAARGVVCRPQQIVITPGAQAAISIATLALTDIGDGAYRWEMEKVGTAQVNIQTIYASKYVPMRPTVSVARSSVTAAAPARATWPRRLAAAPTS